jgi:phosphoglycolate phosphatase
MKRQYDLVVFDWEGTIAEDAYGLVISLLGKEAARFKLDGFDKFIARRYVTLGLSSMVKKLFPQLSMHQHEQLLTVVQEDLNRSARSVCLTEGVEKTIKQISDAGIKLGVASNRALKSLQRVMQLSGLADFFTVVRTASEAPAKPCPQMLEEIIFECDATNERTLMVGDSLTDIEMATSIGVDAIGVDFFNEQTDDFKAAGTIFVMNDYQQLLEYLKI